jgi:hypothetical protein
MLVQRLSDVFPTPTLGLVPEIDVKPALLGNLVLQQRSCATTQLPG